MELYLTDTPKGTFFIAPEVYPEKLDFLSSFSEALIGEKSLQTSVWNS